MDRTATGGAWPRPDESILDLGRCSARRRATCGARWHRAKLGLKAPWCPSEHVLDLLAMKLGPVDDGTIVFSREGRPPRRDPPARASSARGGLTSGARLPMTLLPAAGIARRTRTPSSARPVRPGLMPLKLYGAVIGASRRGRATEMSSGAPAGELEIASARMLLSKREAASPGCVKDGSPPQHPSGATGMRAVSFCENLRRVKRYILPGKQELPVDVRPRLRGMPMNASGRPISRTILGRKQQDGRRGLHRPGRLRLGDDARRRRDRRCRPPLGRRKGDRRGSAAPAIAMLPTKRGIGVADDLEGPVPFRLLVAEGRR